MRKKIIYGVVLLFVTACRSVVCTTSKFQLVNKSNKPYDVILVTGKAQERLPLTDRGSKISRTNIPDKIYVNPRSWSETSFKPKADENVYLNLEGIGSDGKARLSPSKVGLPGKNITKTDIKITKAAPPAAAKTTVETAIPPAPPLPPAGTMNKEEWTKMGLKKGWFSPGSELPQGTSDDLQKQLDKEALEKLLEKISKEAKVDTKKLPVIKEAITAFWEDAGRGQKTSLKLLPLYMFKALEEGDDVATVAGMLGLWMGMPENARDAWRGEKPEKIGAFLEERVRLSKLLVIPTKPDTPEKIKPSAQKKDTRPLEQQAKEWDEEKLRREINKRNFSISGGPFGEKDPKKIEAIKEEIKLLEKIRDSKK